MSQQKDYKGYVAMDPVMAQPKQENPVQYTDNVGVAFQQPAVQPYPMVTSQPMTTTVVQVTMTNANFPRGIPRDWSTPLCGCFEDVGGCLMGWFCFPCYECHVASKMGEACCTPCCFTNATVTMRAHFRGRHNIQGSLVNDSCTGCWCTPCAICQLSRELDNIHGGRAAP